MGSETFHEDARAPGQAVGVLSKKRSAVGTEYWGRILRNTDAFYRGGWVTLIARPLDDETCESSAFGLDAPLVDRDFGTLSGFGEPTDPSLARGRARLEPSACYPVDRQRLSRTSSAVGSPRQHDLVNEEMRLRKERW